MAFPFLERRAGVYGAVGLGLAVDALAFLPEMSALGAFILFLVGSTLAVGSSGYAWWQTRTESRKPPPRQRTALEIFKEDFSHTLSYDGGIRMQRGNVDVEIRWRVHLDFNANSKYVSFFIPRVPPTLETNAPPLHYSMAAQLVENVQRILADMDQNVQISAGGVAQQTVAQGGLLFSRRVFLYYEDYLSPKEQATLIDLYQANGFELQLRGPDYHAYHKLIRKDA